MGIAAKHAYRFGFLKSEWWSNFRLAQLVKAGGKCAICGSGDRLDVHHLWYRASAYETQAEDVVVLCREHHDLAHGDTEPKQYKSLAQAQAAWRKFVIPINRKACRTRALNEFDQEQKRWAACSRKAPPLKPTARPAKPQKPKKPRQLASKTPTARAVREAEWLAMAMRGEVPPCSPARLENLRRQIKSIDARAGTGHSSVKSAKCTARTLLAATRAN